MKKLIIALAAVFALSAGSPASAHYWNGTYVGVGPVGFGVGFGGYPYGYRYGYGSPYPYYDAGYRYGYDGYYPGYYEGGRMRYTTYNAAYSDCNLIRERRVYRHGRLVVRRYCVD